MAKILAVNDCLSYCRMVAGTQIRVSGLWDGATNPVAFIRPGVTAGAAYTTITLTKVGDVWTGSLPSVPAGEYNVEMYSLANPSIETNRVHISAI